jgi:DNA replication and repair protein RecF
MRLVELAVADWRNLPATRLETDARFVVLHGDNAQGKTNLLEAVWTLANLRSFREVRQRRLIRDGADLARVQGRVDGPSGRRTMLWTRARDGGRTLKLDERPVSDLEPWFDVLRAILFCPEHSAIIRGEPAERRGFVDRAAFTARPTHLDVVRQYRRVVQQKGALLRAPGGLDRAQLDAWNQRLATLGATLTVRRLEVLAELAGPFREMHQAIAGSDRVDLALQGSGPAEPDVAAHTASLLEAMGQARADEVRRGLVLVGPHRAELRVRVDGRLARRFASQGQVRSLVLALKLAEIEAARRRGEAPLFLLDDLTSELDQRRMRRLVELLGGLPNQVWITTTDPRWLGPLPADRALRFAVEGGAATRELTE